MEWVNIQHKIFAYLLTNWFYVFYKKVSLILVFVCKTITAWSVQIRSFFLVPIFLQLDWIRIQSKYGKIRTRKNSVFRQFLHSIYSNQSSNCDNSVDLVWEICGHKMIAWILPIVLYFHVYFFYHFVIFTKLYETKYSRVD